MAVKKFRLPKDIPLDEYPKPETYLEEGRRLVDEAARQGLVIRVMGPIALHYYFPDYVDLYRRMERLGERVFTDIDYAAYGKHRGKLVPFFGAQGYDFDKDTMMYFGQDRHIYFGDKIPMIDVFYDKLDMNHLVDYRGRLEIHPHCVSLTDLLLQKLQIVQINDKDLKDAMLLLLAAPLSETDEQGIHLRYLAKRMSDDWGFFYTSTTNLGKVKTAMARVAALDETMRTTICAKADRILAVLENEPKSFGWKLRARTGASKQWYKEVSDWD
ncbi:MAG TPA: hypothetical protein VHO48_01280 [Anaerolineaceae bacterium]|nr:hypothetical protein [Anaerolineaceae bacterium]